MISLHSLSYDPEKGLTPDAPQEGLPMCMHDPNHEKHAEEIATASKILEEVLARFFHLFLSDLFFLSDFHSKCYEESH